MVPVGQYKDYYYPNTQQARTMWYHVSLGSPARKTRWLTSVKDHADHFTSVDAYYGQNGFYIIHDSAEDALGLPCGNYDVPIALMDKRYMNNGQLYSPANETLNFYGDIIHANGQPWPFFNVEPRKYRLRFLNTCLSRAFELWFNDDATGNWLPLNVIASDGGLFAAPVQTTTLDISMGERYEIVFDFAPFAGKNITVGNNMQVSDIVEFDATNQVMRFVVGQTVSDTSNNVLPSYLGGDSMPINRTDVDHVFNFQRNDGNWTINGVVYDDVNARVLARPPQGTIENWQLRYASGPGIHPVHVHLIDFKVVSRSGGRRTVLPYESAGRKDVVLLEPGEVVNVVAQYGPWNGLYQFHCHNLIHEDNNMMAAMNVTALQALGYSDAASFADPNDPAFGPRPYNPADYLPQYITATLMPGLAGSPAYHELSSLASGLQSFWSTRAGGETASLPTGPLATLATTSSAPLTSSQALPSTPTTISSVLISKTSATAKATATNANGGLLGGLLGGLGGILGGILG